MAIFDFLKKKDTRTTVTRTDIVTGNTSVFTTWTGGAYQNDIYREGVDAIARSVGKLKGTHIVDYGSTQKTTDGRLNRLFQVQPNEYMNAFDLFYKLTTHLYLNNNAFALLDRDERGSVVAIYPITCTQAEFMEDQHGRLFVQFRFRNGKAFTFNYADVVHLKRNFNSNELLGDDNGAIIPALELAHTENEGIQNAIRSGAQIRGILKFTSIKNDTQLKQDKEQFIADYLDISNNGGVVAIDNKTEYTPIESKPVTVDPDQTKETRLKIFNYLGISEKIVNASYTEDEWQAFHELVIEPVAIQMSLEFTRKIFTEREMSFGNKIVFDSGRLMYSSNKTKLELISTLIPYGILTINQALEILNLPPVADGDKRLQTLNMVDAEKANEYQLNT